ncbi:melanoma inhibitory activity 3 [Mus musculus]|nr:melanoma inhibitory activity 3 [Mus musculus]
MAAAPGLLFWLFVLGALWWVPGQSDLSHGRRFSDLKVCGDEECSMLMYRGKALEDFTGPDCRFVNFKKGDDVYVYYKLAGGSLELWAGSVEHSFGYFPKDLIKVLHKYTEEELHIPADETDFVCFEGGRDDFNSYNVEELLGSLELEDSVPEESKKAEEVSQHRERSPEESRGRELDPVPEPEAFRADSEDGEGAFSESTGGLQGQPSAQESHPHANGPAANAQGAQSSLDTFEEILHDKLKVPGSESRTGNSSPASVEREKTDAYKVLKTEMSLDLKTKFGSTADALVSDDEATRLVTSLEDGFDEALDAEYYPMEEEEEVEEDADSSDELPLLTFSDKDEKVPGKPMIEKYLTDKDPNLSEEDKVEPPTWGDAFFSIVTGGEGKPGVVDLERSIEEEEDVSVSSSHQRKPQPAAGYTDSEDEGDDLFVEEPKTNDVKDSETDPELVITGEEKDIQESRKGLVQPESQSEDAKSETASAYRLQGSKLNPLSAAEKGRDFTLKAVFEKKENGLKEPVIHISKETLHEDKTREIQRDSLESELVHRALGSSVTENNKPKSLGVAPLLGNNKPDASKDSTEVPDGSVSGPKAGQQEGFLEPGLKTQHQPRFSPPEETGPSRELGGKVPISGRNLSWQEEQDVAAVVSKHANEKTGFPEEESREDGTDAEQARAIRRPQEAESPEVLSVQPGRPDEEEEEEEGDNYPPEGLMEDENALSAQQSRENSPSARDGRSDMNSQVFEKVILGTLNLNTEKTKQPANMILETGQESETTSEEAGDVGKESGHSVVVDSEESHLADMRAQRPSQVHGLRDETAAQTPGSGEAVLSKNPNDLQKDNPEEELVNTLGLEDPGVGEISEGEPEDTKEFGVSESQGTDAEDLRDDPSRQATPEIPDIVLKSIREDLPIINSFFKDDQQSLHRFLKYFDLLATLPDNVQPGPDFYGLPWQPVIITAVLGIVSFAIFSWRTILVVKSRVYQVTEKQISEKLENIKKENAELMQKLSSYEQKIKESKKYVQETKKQNMILSDEAVKYKDKIKILEETNVSLGDKAKSLRLQLESEREQNVKNQDLILENKKSIEKLKDVISMNASELSEVQVALNEAKLSEENVKSECHRVQEENARLKKKKEQELMCFDFQLQQQVEEWSKSHAELTEQIKSFEKSQEDLEIALTHKDDNISALTNCITQLNRLECELESEDPDKGGNESDDLANGETGDQIKKLEDDRSSLQTAKAGLEDECKTLRQKVEILNELYQQKEMALQKKLSQEEYERQDREQRLTAADEKVVLAAEEVKTYKRRIEEMEEELQKTERSFKNQIAAHEKKAHDNWLKARAAERAMAEEKREAANLRHKLLEMTQKMAMRQDEPVIVKPMPGRPNTQNPPRRGLLSQNGSFGPSPVSGGECSPPLPAEPPGRPLSATLSRRDTPRSEFGSLDRHLPRPRWPSEASGKHSASDPGPAPVVNSSSRSSSPAKAVDEGKVNMAPKGPPPFPGVPLMGGPVPPPIRYGPPPQLCGGPFGPRPLPPPFVPGMHPPLGVREYAPGVLPGKRDLPLDPREFLPGHTPFRPPGSLGPREFFIPGTRLPPPTHGPQEYPPPPPAVRDSLPSGPREEAKPASPSSVQDRSQASKPTP